MVVAQSGGPSCVINSTLRGIVEAARDFDSIGQVFAAHHGIEGVLKEALLNLTAQSPEEISLLRVTPAAGSIGTCRYKLKPAQREDFQRVIDVLRAHNVGYFVYIGGNDSMDTAHKISQLAAENGLDLIVAGAPKTIDNDVGDSQFQLIDHTPGYGSCAKYWMHAVAYANQENRGSSPADPVLVMQAMGRKIGFIPAAARLADPAREMPLQIYLAESHCSLEQLHENVNKQLRQDGRCVVVISEGFDVGDIGKVSDSFGHTQFGSSETSVAQTVVNYLNQQGLSVKGKARLNIAGTDQRNSMAYASTVDLDEAYAAGQYAVALMASRTTGMMSTLLRQPGPVYQVHYDAVPLEKVALSERTFPADWICENGFDVSDDFIHYARPLIGQEMLTLPMLDGRPRMTELKPIFAEKKLPAYQPQAERDAK